MALINVVYEYDYRHTFIISIPDELYSDIEKLAQEYLDWFAPTDNELEWVMENGRLYMAKTAKGFVKWLNDNHCSSDNPCVLEKSNVRRDKRIKMIDF